LILSIIPVALILRRPMYATPRVVLERSLQPLVEGTPSRPLLRVRTEANAMVNRVSIWIVVGILGSGLSSPVWSQLQFRGDPPGATSPASMRSVRVAHQAIPAAEAPLGDEELSTTPPRSQEVPPGHEESTLSEPITEGIPEVLGDPQGSPYDLFEYEDDDYLIESDTVQETYSTGSMFMNGNWYVQQDVAVMMPANVKDRAIARAYDLTDDRTANIPTLHSLNIQSVPLRYQPGMRITLGRILGVDHANRQHAIEVGFFGLFDWDNSFSLSSVFEDNNVSTVLPGDPFSLDLRSGVTQSDTGTGRVIEVPGFTQTGIHSLNYTADLNTFELNYRLLGRPPRDRLALQPDGAWVRTTSSSNIKSMFAGIRGATYNELMLYTSETENDNNERGLYEVRLNNRLVGLQLGAQIVERHHTWLFGFRGKTGGLVNFARRNSLYDGFDRLNGSRRLQDELHDEHLTFLAEAGVFTSYELTGRSAVRVSYDVLYFAGMAVASPNMTLGRSFGPLNVEGGALFHGASVGYELVW
jgi:hypothetical protein